MPVHYTYCAYVLIPESVRREFTVQEIKILKLCPPATLPFRNPDDPEIPKTRMLEPKVCVACGIEFKRMLLANEQTFEKATCGSVRCVVALESWLLDAEPLMRRVEDAKDELLTFLDSDLYHLLRSKWLLRHKIKLQS